MSEPELTYEEAREQLVAVPYSAQQRISAAHRHGQVADCL